MLLLFFRANWQHIKWHHNHHYFLQKQENEDHNKPEAESDSFIFNNYPSFPGVYTLSSPENENKCLLS
jgi:hypothetical protein